MVAGIPINRFDEGCLLSFESAQVERDQNNAVTGNRVQQAVQLELRRWHDAIPR